MLPRTFEDKLSYLPPPPPPHTHTPTPSKNRRTSHHATITQREVEKANTAKSKSFIEKPSIIIAERALFNLP